MEYFWGRLKIQMKDCSNKENKNRLLCLGAGHWFSAKFPTERALFPAGLFEKLYSLHVVFTQQAQVEFIALEITPGLQQF